MSCLDDRTLLELREDEAPFEARAHLASCARCAERAARLERDLTLVTRVLREAPIPRTAPRATATRWLVPLAATASLALATFLGWQTGSEYFLPSRHPVRESAKSTLTPFPPFPPFPASEERRLREVSRALFALDPLDPVVQLRRENELGLVEAALGGVHPCERGRSGCAW